jgi:hypothetical protein
MSPTVRLKPLRPKQPEAKFMESYLPKAYGEAEAFKTETTLAFKSEDGQTISKVLLSSPDIRRNLKMGESR